MTAYPCLVCDATQEGQRHFCVRCGGLTTYSQRELAPYEPLSLLVRWEAGSLYRGRVTLHETEANAPLDEEALEDTKTNDPGDKDDHQNTEVWIFTYDEEIVHTPALIRLQQEDRQLAQLPHPNLPKQLDRGHVGHRPYLIFEGRPMALPLPTWRPNLPGHVISTIFSRLAELVVLLQSAGIQRPVIDPFRLMVFWDEERDLLDFQWLPLPELGNYLYREGFTPKVSDTLRAPTSPEEAVPTSLLALDEPSWTTQALHDPGLEQGSRVMRGPLLPQEEDHSQRETTVIQRIDALAGGSSELFDLMSASTDVTADLPTLKAISQKMTETDDFELMKALEELGESSEDLEALARRLAELEQAGRLPAPSQDAALTGAPVESQDGLGETDEDEEPLEEDGLITEASRPQDAHSTDETEPVAGPAGTENDVVAEEGTGSDTTASGEVVAVQEALPGEDLPFVAEPALMSEQEAADLAREMMARLHPPDDEETQPGVSPAAYVRVERMPGTDPSASTPFLESVVVPLEGDVPFGLPPAALPPPQSSSFALPSSIPTPYNAAPPGAAFPASPTKGVLTAQLVVQHHQTMRVQQNHPLDVSLSPLSPVSPGDGVSPLHPPKVILTPVFPGCIVSPVEATLERWDQQVRFWVTPMVPGDLRDAASLQSRAEGAPVTAISLPCTSRKATFPRLVTLVAIAFASVALVPPPNVQHSVIDSLWLFFHHWGFVVAGVLAIIVMLARWWPRPLTPTVTRTAFRMDDSPKLLM